MGVDGPPRAVPVKMYVVLTREASRLHHEENVMHRRHSVECRPHNLFCGTFFVLSHRGVMAQKEGVEAINFGIVVVLLHPTLPFILWCGHQVRVIEEDAMSENFIFKTG